jgi:drug/metabolite transporter superfamily protein YnfA
MPETKTNQEQARCRTPRWQFSLWDLLVLTLVVSVLMAAEQTFQGRLGPIELVLIILSAISILAAGIPSRARWPWYVGLVLCLVAAWLLRLPPGIKVGVVGALGGVYVLAGLPVVWPTSRSEKRWPWMQGAFGCFVVAALITAADPVSMLLVAAPLCLCYLAVAIAGKKRRSNLRVIGPAVLVVGLLVAIGCCFVAVSWADLLVRIGVAVAALGVIAATVGWSEGIDGATSPGSAERRLPDRHGF